MAKFKYKYADVACEYCLHYKNCRYTKCPHIMDNIDDLKKDRAFREAVANADSCDNKHWHTLVYLKKIFEQMER